MTSTLSTRVVKGPLARLIMAASVLALAQVLWTAAPASAATYYFKPGHPTYFGGPGTGGYCTGGYAIRGGSGTFILTAGHCGSVCTTVYGTSRAFGTIAHTRWSSHDTALISEYPVTMPGRSSLTL